MIAVQPSNFHGVCGGVNGLNGCSPHDSVMTAMCSIPNTAILTLSWLQVWLSGPKQVISFSEIPGFTGDLDELTELNLAGHELLGVLPSLSLSRLSKMRVLKLSGPLTNSSLPSEWSALGSLQTLWLLNMRGLQGNCYTRILHNSCPLLMSCYQYFRTVLCTCNEQVGRAGNLCRCPALLPLAGAAHFLPVGQA